jgi:oligopeptide/dipeptide ABC transporter ATP-binding protein
MLTLHLRMKKPQAVDKALECLDVVGLGKSPRVLNSYPHELSGGMKQRAMIAMAICCNPALLIADEPTTALDVTLQLQILKLIRSLKQQFSMGILFISHNLGIVRQIADTISVIYAGKIVESAPKHELFENTLHPYTRALLQSIPDAEKRGRRLRAIPGMVPDAENIPPGCSFHPRCSLAQAQCRRDMPVTRDYGHGHFAACLAVAQNNTGNRKR